MMEIKTLFEDGAVGHYSFCEVTQIIIYDKQEKEYWNYFTNIFFSRSYKEGNEEQWLTAKPMAINDRFQVMIKKQVLPAKKVVDTVDCAVESQMWEYEDDCARLDEVFIIDPRFVPETDPTGNKKSEYTSVPIESSLYGSNFIGNYYVVELFSSKKYLESVLTAKDRKKIQEIINSCHLQYDLVNLGDRVGNVLCKLAAEILNHKSLKLGPENGIVGRLSRGNDTRREVSCFINILTVSDNTIIENIIIPFVLNDDNPDYEYSIEANRNQNRITVVDQNTGVVYYSAERDYSFGSDYYSQIRPPKFVSTTSEDRILKVGGIENKTETYNVFGSGTISIEKEIYEFSRRQIRWKDAEKVKNHYFQSFKKGQELEAVNFFIDILNDKSLFWDLKEICLIDPYLSAKDILKTVVHCDKYGIKIRCLTNLGTINNNKATQINVDKGDDKFHESKSVFNNELMEAIPAQTDIQLEFRTVRGIYGEPFHDRYLILNYDLNRCRAWSIGISVNALGTSHHLIQIVESPVEVAEMFEKIWEDTNNSECLIYSNWRGKQEAI